MATLYFNGVVDGNWTTLGNWWVDSNCTIQSNTIPQSVDDVIILGGLSYPTFIPDNTTINSLVHNTGGGYLDLYNNTTVNITTNCTIGNGHYFLLQDYATLNVGDTLTINGGSDLRFAGSYSTVNAVDILIDNKSYISSTNGTVDIYYSNGSNNLNATNTITFNYSSLYGSTTSYAFYSNCPLITFDNNSYISSNAYLNCTHPSGSVVFSGSETASGYQSAARCDGSLSAANITFNDYSYVGVIDGSFEKSISATTITFNDYSWCGIDGYYSSSITNIVFNDYSANGILYTTSNPGSYCQWTYYTLLSATNITFNDSSGHGKVSSVNGSWIHVGGISGGNVAFNDNSVCGGPPASIGGLIYYASTGWFYNSPSITFNDNSKNLNGLYGINPTLNNAGITVVVAGINGSSILGIV